MSLDPAISDEVFLADVYGPSFGQDTGIQATNATGEISSTSIGRAAGISAGGAGFMGHTLTWWAIGAGLVIGLWALFQHVGPPEERKNFANLELSFVNVLLISLVPLVGIPMWKAVFTLLPVPAGVKAFVNAA